MRLIRYDLVFNTEDEAKSFIAEKLRSYHPAGYDTRFDPPVRVGESGKWRVIGSRYSSCD